MARKSAAKVSAKGGSKGAVKTTMSAVFGKRTMKRGGRSR